MSILMLRYIARLKTCVNDNNKKYIEKNIQDQAEQTEKSSRLPMNCDELSFLSRLCLDFMISHCAGDIMINQFH